MPIVAREIGSLNELQDHVLHDITLNPYGKVVGINWAYWSVEVYCNDCDRVIVDLVDEEEERKQVGRGTEAS